MANRNTMTGDIASMTPAQHAAAVTTSDETDLTETTRALYVGGEGNISVEMEGGETVTFTGVPAGMLLPVCVTRVNATDTTATNIVALW